MDEVPTRNRPGTPAPLVLLGSGNTFEWPGGNSRTFGRGLPVQNSLPDHGLSHTQRVSPIIYISTPPPPLAKPRSMARKPRLEFPGAIYHVISRGNYRMPIFEEGGGAAFEKALFQACAKCGWRLHAYVSPCREPGASWIYDLRTSG